MTMKCPYCATSPLRHDEFLGYENEEVLAFPAAAQAASNLGHSLLVTRQHTRDLYELDDSLLSHVWEGLRETSAAVRSAFAADGITIRQNNGRPGQHTLHTHFHVVPRHHTDGHDGFAPALDDISPEDRAAQARAIRSSLGTTVPSPSGPCTCCVPPDPFVVHEDEQIVAVTAAEQRADQLGEIWVFTRAHVRGLQETPTELGTRLLIAVRDCALAVESAFGASGTTIRLHDGSQNQELGHVGFHIVPRHLQDNFLTTRPEPCAEDVRKTLTDLCRRSLLSQDR